MKDCPYCRALVRDDRLTCGVCGTVFRTEAGALEKRARPNPLAQAATILSDSLSFLRRHGDLFLLPSLLALLWLSLVAIPGIVLFSQPRPEDGLDRLLSFLDIRNFQQPMAPAILQFRAASLFGNYFWLYALIVSGILSEVYILGFPLMVDQAVKRGHVSVEAAFRDALRGFRRTLAGLLLYVLIVFVGGIMLYDFIFLPAGDVFPPDGALISSILFTLFWSYATIRLWLVFPAMGIDRAGVSEAFGLSVDSTRGNVRSSYACALVLLAVLYVARAAVSASLVWISDSTLVAGIVAIVSIVVGGTIVGVVPSVYYYRMALRTDVKSVSRPSLLEALQEAR